MDKYLRIKIDMLKEEFKRLREDKIEIKVDGNINKLMELNNEFNDTEDNFFDQEDLRKKYNDYDFENEEILLKKSNEELENELDKEDLEQFIKFYENSISILQDEIDELKEAN